MGQQTEFKEVFSWWYLLAALVTLLAFPLLHVIAGWFRFWL